MESNVEAIRTFWINLKAGMPVEKAREIFYGKIDHTQVERIAQTDEPAGWRWQGEYDSGNCDYSTWKP